MMICEKCKTEITDDIQFCPNCGANLDAPTSKPTSSASDAINKLNDTSDTTSEYDSKDISENKVMALLSYLGILFVIPLFAAPKSKFARFHANQGLILCISGIAYSIINSILMSILNSIFRGYWNGYLTYTRGPIHGFLSLILNLLYVIFAILAVIGIINAVNGKAKELPLIGKFKILK